MDKQILKLGINKDNVVLFLSVVINCCYIQLIFYWNFSISSRFPEKKLFPPLEKNFDKLSYSLTCRFIMRSKAIPMVIKSVVYLQTARSNQHRFQCAFFNDTDYRNNICSSAFSVLTFNKNVYKHVYYYFQTLQEVYIITVLIIWDT